MELLVFVLNKPDELEPLLKAFVDIGIKGATVIDTQGMATFFDKTEDLPMFGSLKMLVNKNHKSNKTIFVVLNHDLVKTAIQTIKDVVGDLSEPNVGILFTLPLSHVEGGTLTY